MTDHELLLDLQRRVEALEALATSSEAQTSFASNAVNFSLNPNAFISKYAQGKTGKEKFTWLVALLARGDEAVDVPMKEIEKLWNRMTAKSLLGMKFNYKYSNEAKTNGWVDSPKTGSYRLAAGWYEIYNDGQQEGK